MVDNSNDRNLLLVAAALRMGLIRSDQLRAAKTAWSKNSQRPLDTILVEQHVLDAHMRDLLLALVDKQLELHNGSPQQSLATLTHSATAVVEELNSLMDDDTHATLSLATERADDTKQANRERSPRRETSNDERYQVIRLHARGGLGRVSVALDTELRREVALKEIQDAYADDPANRSRFLLEAEVTGCLEHPGIVPVYGLGVHADGRPFYAMRLIRGESFKDAIERFHASHPPGQRSIIAWSSASCWIVLSMCATRSPSLTAVACCTET